MARMSAERYRARPSSKLNRSFASTFSAIERSRGSSVWNPCRAEETLVAAEGWSVVDIELMIAEGRARGQPVSSAKLSSAAYFRHPPSRAYQEKAPVMKELRKLAFKGMANELENPRDDEE